MKEKKDKLILSESQTDNNGKDDKQGYPAYPASEDIYKNFQEEADINPEDISKTKVLNSTNYSRRKELDNENSENDLDIPGSELDDQQENIGSEDEENNYYSLGGDDHEDLEEDQGD